MINVSDLKPATVEELVDTLRYLKREFDRNNFLDKINMRHVRKVLDMVDHDQASALYRKIGDTADTEAATKGD